MLGLQVDLLLLDDQLPGGNVLRGDIVAPRSGALLLWWWGHHAGVGKLSA